MCIRDRSIDESNTYTLIGLGYLYYDFKDYRAALANWEKVYAIDSKRVDVRVLTGLGNCHRKLRNYREGLFYFEQVLVVDKKNFFALFGIADCYRGMDQMEKSLEYWNYILAEDLANKVILTRAGDALRHLGRFVDAEQHYRRALDVNFDVYAVLGLALVLKEQGLSLIHI